MVPVSLWLRGQGQRAALDSGWMVKALSSGGLQRFVAGGLAAGMAAGVLTRCQCCVTSLWEASVCMGKGPGVSPRRQGSCPTPSALGSSPGATSHRCVLASLLTVTAS